MKNHRSNDKSKKSDFDFIRSGYEEQEKISSNYYYTPDSNYRLAPYERRGGPLFEYPDLVENRRQRQSNYQEEEFRYSRSGDYGYQNQTKGDHYTARKELGFVASLKDSIENYFGKGPKGYRRSDERIHEDICEILYHHPQIDASEIEVEVKNGVVSLGGSVESRRLKRLTEEVIENCPGIVDIHNQIRVLP